MHPQIGDIVRICKTAGLRVRLFTNGDLLFLPYDAAVRQLLRAGFDDGQDEHGQDQVDFSAVVGETLHFERTHNPKKGAKPFWDVSVASGAEKRPAPPSKRVESPYATPTASSTDGSEQFAQSLRDDPQGTGNQPASQEPGDSTEQDAIEHRKHSARQQAAKRYLALWDVVAAHQTAKGKELDMPVDGMSVNAATATLWIYFGNKGML